MTKTISRRDLFAPPATDLDALVHIASLLVHGTPAACLSVKALLKDSPGAEVHETAQSGKLAVVLESADDRAIAQTASRLQDIAGVVSVSIVAHVVESERSLQEDYRIG